MNTNGRRFTPVSSLIFVSLLCAGMTSCVSYPQKSESILSRFSQQAWHPQWHEAAGFSFRSWRSPQSGGPQLLVFIEGDGRAWVSRRRVSKDPTPRKAVAAAMALASGKHDIVYIARPCQFLEPDALAQCEPRFWTGARYSEQVVTAISGAIDAALRETGHRKLTLIAFSGGAAIASLLAARRDDIDLLISFAGNLDIDAWTEFHQVSELSESLNPLDDANSLRHLAQHHFAGAKDSIMPPQLIQAFSRELDAPEQVHVHVLPDYDHDCCWLDRWPQIVCDKLGAEAPANLCQHGSMSPSQPMENNGV